MLPRRSVRVPDDLFAAARTALGLPETAPPSEVVRGALALAAGTEAPVLKRGRRKGQAMPPRPQRQPA